ncbi:MAG: gamma-glutamyl-gamma-aminobutyrate hydrolase family protein [Bacilli bacterium]|nr:gamma-glutamyl-gamma-aminobutyrate hydrolase family protein [Bacilli bacterium]
MKLIGIVGRAYFNKDKQNIIQINEYIRRAITNYDDVVPIAILPTNDICYSDIDTGKDSITSKDKKKLDYILDKCDAFIIPGGTYFYKFDEYIIEYARKSNKPLLAICLGFQALCSMYSPNRTKTDMTKKLPNDNHCGNSRKYIHNIDIKKDSKLYEIIEKDNIPINSIHHDYIDFIPNSLTVSAYSEDGIIEAVEDKKHKFFIGLEWHPEYILDEYSIKIFDAFINSIKG